MKALPTHKHFTPRKNDVFFSKKKQNNREAVSNSEA